MGITQEWKEWRRNGRFSPEMKGFGQEYPKRVFLTYTSRSQDTHTRDLPLPQELELLDPCGVVDLWYYQEKEGDHYSMYVVYPTT